MRDFLVGARVRLAPAVLYLMHFAVAVLVVVSIVEVWQTAVDVVRTIIRVDGILLATALAAALIPAGCVIFWGCDAIAVQLARPFSQVRPYFRHHRDGKSLPE